MQTNDFKSWLLRSAGIGAGIFGFLFILILLVGNDISSRSEQIVAQRVGLEARLEALNSLIGLRAGADRASRLLPKLQEALPAKDQLINFSKFIDTQARQNRLEQLFLFESETASTPSVPGINKFALTLSGAYSDYIRFLGELEKSPYYINISTMDIEEKEGKFNISIKGEIYSQ